MTARESVLEIEFLTGVCRAAIGPASDVPDWPPQPDRVFSALVCAWAVRGERRIERTALEWLETQEPPTIHASRHVARTAPDVFVPPNDLKYSKAAKTCIKVMPEARPRQPRRFPVARPDNPVMAMVWPEEPAPETLETLDMVARDDARIWRSCRWRSPAFRMPTAGYSVSHWSLPPIRNSWTFLDSFRHSKESRHTIVAGSVAC